MRQKAGLTPAFCSLEGLSPIKRESSATHSAPRVPASTEAKCMIQPAR